MEQEVIDKNSGQVLFQGTAEECRDYIIKSNNEFATLR